MRLRFSRTADYGLRAALEVARARDGVLVTRQTLADATGAPSSVLAQALAALVRAGLLDAQAGPRGGYRLARPADAVSIHDVVVAIDPQESQPQCVLRESACEEAGHCPFHRFLTEAQDRFLDALRSTSLADVTAPGALVALGEAR
jgi:Rrf2 family protein